VHRLFFDDDDLARIRRIAVIALARHPVAAGAAKLVIEGFLRMVLAHPSDAATDRATELHRLKIIRRAQWKEKSVFPIFLFSQLLHGLTT
jgi:hypothetical protein